MGVGGAHGVAAEGGAAFRGTITTTTLPGEGAAEGQAGVAAAALVDEATLEAAPLRAFHRT